MLNIFLSKFSLSQTVSPRFPNLLGSGVELGGTFKKPTKNDTLWTELEQGRRQFMKE